MSSTSVAKQILKETFQNTTIEQLVGQKKNLLSFTADETISHAIQQLMKWDVRSAPIYSHKEKTQKASEVHFIDFSDIIAFMVDTYRQALVEMANINNTPVSPRKNITIQLLQNQEVAKAILDTPVIKVANYSKMDAHGTLTLAATAMDAIQQFALGNKRIIIEDEAGMIINVVSHSDVIKLMKEIIDENEGNTVFNATCHELHLSRELKCCADENMRTIDVFVMMSEHKVNFVPIVSEEKHLISVLSSRDIQMVSEGEFALLDLPVIDFLSAVRQKSVNEKYPYIYCKPDSTLELIVKRLKATRVHRLIVLENQFPSAVVSTQSLVNLVNRP
ncbi:predicted protein [Naegleria gruberi]|uniref:Predicted protein n=1 Tax=Naegleria gruberi TaxID=5762 RepID=D2V5Q2_NAEGR|nr:uncharacterized protein NAEGRDRAFT_46881 [Naegleria gruberi]EFC47837.1 predicted protein [Naegleria gruberi]|eukprot:XP_002680581.1 predicted protein [Naegleria gruberi strain NEG-M]